MVNSAHQDQRPSLRQSIVMGRGVLGLAFGLIESACHEAEAAIDVMSPRAAEKLHRHICGAAPEMTLIGQIGERKEPARKTEIREAYEHFLQSGP